MRPLGGDTMTCAEYPVTPLRLGVVGPLTEREAIRAIAVKVARLDAIWREIVALGFHGDDAQRDALRAEREAVLEEISAIRNAVHAMPRGTP